MRNLHRRRVTAGDSDDAALENSENADVGAHETSVEDDDIIISESLPATDVPTIIFPCISDALTWLSCGRCPNLEGELSIPPSISPPVELQAASQVQVDLEYASFV